MSDSPLQVVVERQNGATVVTLSGKINSRTAADMEHQLLDLFDDEGVRIIVDFSGVTFLSSAGLRVLLMGAKRANTMRGKFLCCAMRDGIKDVFEKCGLSTIIRHFPERTDALAAAK